MTMTSTALPTKIFMHQTLTIEQRLARLQRIEPGRRYRVKNISERTGISRRTIKRIEDSALEKLRAALGAALPKGFFEELAPTRTQPLPCLQP